MHGDEQIRCHDRCSAQAFLFCDNTLPFVSFSSLFLLALHSQGAYASLRCRKLAARGWRGTKHAVAWIPTAQLHLTPTWAQQAALYRGRLSSLIRSPRLHPRHLGLCDGCPRGCCIAFAQAPIFWANPVAIDDILEDVVVLPMLWY